MRARPLLFSILALSASIASHAQERFHYQAGQSQTAEEIEDIGEITESSAATSPDGKATADGKTVSTPPAASNTKFRFNVSTRGSYTSNAQLSGDHGSGDFIFFPSIEAGLNSVLGNGFTFDLAGRVDSGLYARHDERAFIGYGATATLDWRPKPTAPRIFISAEPYRYDNFDLGNSITQAVGGSVGTDWGVPFNQGNSMAFVGYNFTHYLSDPDTDTRNAHRAVVGVTHTLRPQVYAQLLYSYNYDHYTGFDRKDSRHIVAASVTWQVNRHWFAALSGTFVDNDSTQNRASYQSAGAGLQVTWNY